MAPSIVLNACLTPGIEKAPWTCAVKQALSARICRSLDAVFIVVQPIVSCLSVGRFSAAFGSWKSLIQGRTGVPRPDRAAKISGKGDSGQPSCYVPDFISHRLKLIIEVDGAHHSFDDQQRHDERRTKWFESPGYRVIRFWNHEIKNELDSVLDTIYAAVEERKSHHGPRDAEGA
ncbi:endonuclease domain-containing protein [Mesorhizobium sp. 43Arga]